VRRHQGLIKEEASGTALDAGLLAACQAVKHYEISRYGSLREWAKDLGLDEAHKLLSEILGQEKATMFGSFRDQIAGVGFATIRIFRGHAIMPRFFFDVSERGDVYHDARGTILPSFGAARQRAFDIVRKLRPGPRDQTDAICTVRDAGGHLLTQVSSERAR
jgi:hypothetical protein